MPPVLTLAHGVSSILQEHFFVVPAWGIWVEYAVYLAVAALSHRAAAAPWRRHGCGGHRRAAGGADRNALRADDREGHVAPAHAAGGAARRRPSAAHHQALPRHRARQGALGRRGRGLEPDARARVPGPGPARHGVRLLPQVPGRRHPARQSVQPRARLRAQAPVQQGRVRVPLHGRPQPEVPRRGRAHVAGEAALGDDYLRRRSDASRRHDAARARHRETDARPLPGRARARQGRDGRRLPGPRPQDRPGGRDQDDGARRRSSRPTSSPT